MGVEGVSNIVGVGDELGLSGEEGEEEDGVEELDGQGEGFRARVEGGSGGCGASVQTIFDDNCNRTSSCLQFRDCLFVFS